MANNGWYFNPMSRKHKQSSNDDFRSAFKSNKDLAEALLREFYQNAGDAATGRSPRQIRICFRTISPSVISKYLNGSATIASARRFSFSRKVAWPSLFHYGASRLW